ncbi:MAG TPA: hypothetical protein VGD98_07820 [Ktedonobacteraceae bacterium]
MATRAGRCPNISTERIMRAVEERRQVSQQLEDLREQQKQRTEHLRTGLKFMSVLCCGAGVLAFGFVLLLILRPVLLERTLNSLDDSIAILVVLSERMRMGLALIPAGSWVLSVAALIVVLLMGLWIRLMRYPRDA